MPGAIPEPVTVEELLQHGSKEPLTPPVIHIDVELAPGSSVTAEPLTPPVVSAYPVELAPGSITTAAPITPPVIQAEDAPTAQ